MAATGASFFSSFFCNMRCILLIYTYILLQPSCMTAEVSDFEKSIKVVVVATKVDTHTCSLSTKLQNPAPRMASLQNNLDTDVHIFMRVTFS